MKKILGCLFLMFFGGVAFSAPTVSIVDRDANILDINADGSVNVSIAGSTTFGGTITAPYGINVSTLVVQDTIISGDITSTGTITATASVIGVAGTFSGALTGTTLDTGQGANELYDMNQNVQTTSAVTFSSVTITYSLGIGSITASDVITAATFNSGQGNNELYAMSQNVRTTDPVTFSSATITYGLSVGSMTTTGLISSGTSESATYTATTAVVTPKCTLNTAFEIGVATPTATGQLMRNAAFELYIASGTTNCYQWIKVGGQ